MKRFCLVLAILMICLFSTTAFAQRIVGWPVVPPITDGTIQSAVIALGVGGGIIDVDPSYNPAAGGETFPVCINLNASPLTIQGRPGTTLPVLVPGNTTDKIFVVSKSQVTIQDLRFIWAGGGDGYCGSPFGLAGAIYLGPVINTIVIQRCEFLDNNTNFGAAIFVDSSSQVAVDYCIFVGNTANEDGGAIDVYQSKDVSITNSYFENNLALGGSGSPFGRGGAVYVDTCAGTITYPYDVFIQNCRFITNNSAWEGGAISWWYSDGVITSNTITANTTQYGGGISIVNCRTSPALTLVDRNWINFNQANGVLPCPFNGGHGGGIYIEDSYDCVRVENINEISTNTATFFGGGITTLAYSWDCYPQIVENWIYDNDVLALCDPAIRNGGGGIAVETYMTQWINFPLISANLIEHNETLTPGTYGGGIGLFGDIYAPSLAAAQIQINVIHANIARDLGGGISALDSFLLPTETIDDNQITSNSAITHGGGVYLAGCPIVQFNRNNIDRNAEHTHNPGILAGGGGLYSWDSTFELRSNNLTRNSAATFGTAAAIDGCSGGGCSVLFYNNTIADNFGLTSPFPKAAVDFWFCNPDFTNNIFSNHPAQIAVREPFGDGTQQFTNNLFFNNGGIFQDFALGLLNLAQLNGQGWATGNITGDPLLDSTYHLSTYVSPAYDAGVDLTAQGVTFDIDNEARPYAIAFDIGSDELYQAAGVDDWLLY